MKLLYLFAAGGIGTLSRYSLTLFMGRIVGTSFPWGTLIVNIVGCLLFGLIYGLGETRSWLTQEVRLIILVGFMGAFTTFSSLAFEAVTMFQSGQWLSATLHLLGHYVVGIAALWAGIVIAKGM